MHRVAALAAHLGPPAAGRRGPARRCSSPASSLQRLRKVLVANRGEIAIRVCRAAQELGVSSVAVYTPEDSGELHAAVADEACALPERGYLDPDALVAAALRHKCDSVHPGYGFLSESAEFCAKVRRAGLTFIGPSPECLSIAADKIQARRCAVGAGVTVARGSDGVLSSPAAVRDFLRGQGFPIILKAANGGGGKGIRRVDRDSELDDAFARCTSEAANAFGAGGGVFAEEYISGARHVEVQLLGDSRGSVVHLFDRDCSVQSAGHQKVVEVAPAVGLGAGLRERMLAEAVRLGAAMGLCGAATAEFLAADGHPPVFLEVNPRIQVEHTVTEEVTGLDIVRLQFQLADGMSLAEVGVVQNEVRCIGHALQARLSATAPGAVTALHLPAGPGVRVDTAAHVGWQPSPMYDPLVAKVIVHARGPFTALLTRARRALGELAVGGVPTNAALLRGILASADFAEGRVTTAWLSAGPKLPETSEPPRRLLGPMTAAAGTEAPQAPLPAGAVAAPVAGVVVAVRVSKGDNVAQGQPLAVLTSMKMETVVAASRAGRVTEVLVRQGETVREGAPVVVVEEAEGAAAEAAAEGRAAKKGPSLWAQRVAELALRRQLAAQHGGPEAVARQHAQGRLTVRERAELLLDRGSYRPVGGAAGVPERDAEGKLVGLTPPNFLLGLGKVDGRPVVVGGEDFTIQGGSPNVTGLRKSVYTETLPLELRVPLVRLHEGGGGSVGGASDRKRKETPQPKKKPPQMYDGVPVYSPHRFTHVAEVLSQVPVASAALGSVAGLPASRLVASHFCVMSKSTAEVITAGPKVVERALGYQISKRELGGWEVHRASGVVDNFAETEAEAIAQIRRFLSYLPSNVWQLPPVIPCSDPHDRQEQALLDFVPENRRHTYDVRELLRLVFDKDEQGGSSVFEWGTTDFGRTQVCAFARLRGVPVGTFANDCRYFAGAMTADAAQKVRRFIEMCEVFHLPIIAFVDEPGFMLGLEAERAGTIRYGTQAVLAAAQCRVPWCSIHVRKMYGVASAAHFAPSCNVLAWPSAEAGALPVESGVAILHRRELEQARATGGPAAAEALRQRLEDAFARGLSPWPRADSLSVHDVIDPRETRPRLCEWLELVQPRLQSLLGVTTFTLR